MTHARASVYGNSKLPVKPKVAAWETCTHVGKAQGLLEGVLTLLTSAEPGMQEIQGYKVRSPHCACPKMSFFQKRKKEKEQCEVITRKEKPNIILYEICELTVPYDFIARGVKRSSSGMQKVLCSIMFLNQKVTNSDSVLKPHHPYTEEVLGGS